MSTSLLVRKAKTAEPSAISRETSKVSDAINAYHANNANLSLEVSRLVSFDENSYVVREGELTDRLPAREEQMIPKKTVLSELSFRMVVAMFLAQTYDYTYPGKIVLISPYISSTSESINDFVRTFYPAATVVFPTRTMLADIITNGGSENVDANIEKVRNPLEITPITYLISLGKSIAKHQIYVKYYTPRHALFGLEILPDSEFSFYPGNMWIPPFMPGETLMFMRAFKPGKSAKIKEVVWDYSSLHAALKRHSRITNDNTTYINVFTGADSYLFEKYPNDFSHTFALVALMLYIKKLSLPEECRTESKISEIFGPFVSPR